MLSKTPTGDMCPITVTLLLSRSILNDVTPGFFQKKIELLHVSNLWFQYFWGKKKTFAFIFVADFPILSKANKYLTKPQEPIMCWLSPCEKQLLVYYTWQLVGLASASFKMWLLHQMWTFNAPHLLWFGATWNKAENDMTKRQKRRFFESVILKLRCR